MIQTVVKGKGGTIWTEFLGRRPSACSVVVYDGAGVTKSTGAGTPDPVNTTISAGALQGDTEIDVASTTNIVSGKRYLLENEDVGVKSISGTTLTLWAPLVRDHDSGATFQGVRVSYAVSAADAAALWTDGYAIFTPDAGDPQVEALHCTKHKIPDVMISEYDVRKIQPKSQGALAFELDLDVAYRDARDNFLIDLGGKAVTHAIIGVAQFRRLVSMRFWLDREMEFGSQWDLTRVREEYFRYIDKGVSVSPVDADGDGATVSGPEKHALTGLDLESL